VKQLFRQFAFPICLIILAPVLATLTLCYAFQDGVILGTPFGIVDQDNSALSRALVKQIAENETFDVIFYGDAPDQLQQQIEQNQVIAGVVIPKNFSKDVSAGKSPSILTVYDGSQMSVAGITKVKMTEVLTTLKVAASIQVLEAKLNLQPEEALFYVQPIGNTCRYLGNPAKSLTNYVMSGAIANIVQLAMYILMIEAIRKEGEERVHPLLYCLLGSILCTAVLMYCIWLMHVLFGIPMNGSWTAAVVLSFLNMLGIGSLAACVRLLLPNKLKNIAIQSALIAMAMMVFSGYTFPSMSMPPLFQFIAENIPFTHFALPLRDVMLMGSSIQLVLPEIRWLFFFAIGNSAVLALLWSGYQYKCRRQARAGKAATPQQLPLAEQEATLC